MLLNFKVKELERDPKGKPGKSGTWEKVVNASSMICPHVLTPQIITITILKFVQLWLKLENLLTLFSVIPPRKAQQICSKFNLLTTEKHEAVTSSRQNNWLFIFRVVFSEVQCSLPASHVLTPGDDDQRSWNIDLRTKETPWYSYCYM